jgi:hypothetical protein
LEGVHFSSLGINDTFHHFICLSFELWAYFPDEFVSISVSKSRTAFAKTVVGTSFGDSRWEFSLSEGNDLEFWFASNILIQLHPRKLSQLRHSVLLTNPRLHIKLTIKTSPFLKSHIDQISLLDRRRSLTSYNPYSFEFSLDRNLNEVSVLAVHSSANVGCGGVTVRGEKVGG